MSDKYFAKKINLHANEELIAILHHHPMTYAKQIAVTAILILGSFFFMFALFSQGEIGVALFCALIITGVIYGSREFYIWFANSCVVTSQRLVDIDQQGIFHKIVSDVDYAKIIDISYSVNGISQTIFNIGSIKVQSSGATLLLKNIKEPGKVNQLLVDLIRKQTGKEMEVKKVVSVGSKAKEKMIADFVNQDDLAEYEDYNLNELIEEYKGTFGELSLKKLIVDGLEEEEGKDGEASFAKASEAKEENSEEKKEEDEIKGNFRQKRL
jgi:hypothetical protein